MRRVLILVEGQTEETFVREILAPRLNSGGVWPTAVIVATKRIAMGGKFKGGLASYAKVRREILLLLGDTNARLVTTMFDVYGLPNDFPGYATRPDGPPAGKATHLEDALRADVNDPRFRPYLSLHEFEALLFADPDAIVEKVVAASGEPRKRTLREMRSQFGTPEDIDDDPATAPSKRILEVLPEYDKARHGPLIAQTIGLDRIRRECPHFDAWVVELEALGSQPEPDP